MELGFSLGSNDGDTVENLRQAKARILAVPDTRWLAQSPLYETEPVGVSSEYAHLRFLNAVLIIDTPAGADEWLSALHDIEYALGRRRTGDRNAPRTIDIDILYAGDDYIDRGGLVVPHPRWAERRFVVQPLADVRPQLVLPGSGRTVSAILADLVGEDVTRTDLDW